MNLTLNHQLTSEELRDLATQTWVIDGMLLDDCPPTGNYEPLSEIDAIKIRDQLAHAVEQGTHTVTVRERRASSISFFVDGPDRPKGFFSIVFH